MALTIYQRRTPVAERPIGIPVMHHSRSVAVPHVEIAVRQGRPAEKIRTMISAVTKAVAESLESPMESIRVIVVEVPTTHWATGDVTLAEKLSSRDSASGAVEPQVKTEAPRG